MKGILADLGGECKADAAAAVVYLVTISRGKSTLVMPFGQLYGHSIVFHKPAMTSSFPLAKAKGT